MKQIIWDQKALEEVRSFSSDVRQEIGSLLRLLQEGFTLGAPQSKPLKQIGASMFELRIRDRGGNYRLLYVLFDKNRIFVPHAFMKKTQKTPKHEIDTALKRLRRLIYENE